MYLIIILYKSKRKQATKNILDEKVGGMYDLKSIYCSR